MQSFTDWSTMGSSTMDTRSSSVVPSPTVTAREGRARNSNELHDRILASMRMGFLYTALSNSLQPFQVHDLIKGLHPAIPISFIRIPTGHRGESISLNILNIFTKFASYLPTHKFPTQSSRYTLILLLHWKYISGFTSQSCFSSNLPLVYVFLSW